MIETESQESFTGSNLALRLKTLRKSRNWSLDQLAAHTGVSRATLSRIENSDVSPTTKILSALCAVYGLTMSRLMHMVEDSFEPLVRKNKQSLWADTDTGFQRRSVSPPARTLAGEALECSLAPNTHIEYASSPRPGLEHHLIMLEGSLSVRFDDQVHNLWSGDCLRYQLYSASSYTTPEACGAKYILFVV